MDALATLPGARRACAVILLAVGLLTAAPVIVAFAPGRAHALYGLHRDAMADPAQAVLLRHRAVLFGVLGALLVTAAFVPALALPVAIAAVVSKVAFIALVAALAPSTAALRRVAAIDVVALAALLVAVALARARAS